MPSPNYQGIRQYLDSNLEAIRKTLGADALCVYSRNAEKEEAQLVGWSGEEKPREVAPFDLPPIGTCAKTGKGLLIERNRAQGEKYQSIVVVPLQFKEFHLGVLFGASAKPSFFKDGENLASLRAISEDLSKTWVSPISGEKH